MSVTTMLTTLIRNWSGDAPPPVTARRASARWGAGRPAVHELALRVRGIVNETPTVKTFLLEPVSGSLSWQAGQHLTFLVDVDGRPQRRCYSFSSSPLSGAGAAVSVRRVDGGAVSPFFHDHVRVGDTLKATPPSGSFTLPAEDGPERRFVFAGGGVGLTPLISLAETALRRDTNVEVDLLCGHRSEDEILFAARIEALQQEFGPRLRVRISLDHAPKGWTGLTGALGGSRVLEEAGAGADAYYVCGPEPMMDDVASALERAGVEPSRIRIERFAYAAAAPSSAPSTAREIRFDKAGRTIVAEAGQTILDAATKAGLDLPFSCTMGGCGACKVKKSAGTVVTAEPNCLTDAERAEGYVLTCCSWADDGLVIADH